MGKFLEEQVKINKKFVNEFSSVFKKIEEEDHKRRVLTYSAGVISVCREFANLKKEKLRKELDNVFGGKK